MSQRKMKSFYGQFIITIDISEIFYFFFIKQEFINLDTENLTIKIIFFKYLDQSQFPCTNR
jgi:hypothetical protein